LLGVLAGSFIPIFKDWWFAKSKQKEDAYYSSIRLICILEAYGDLCFEVVFDDEDNHFYNIPGTMPVNTPDPIKFADDIKWKSLMKSLSYDIMSLPDKAERVNNNIKRMKFYDEGWYSYRTESYIELGILALKIAIKLRCEYKIEDTFSSNKLNIPLGEIIKQLEDERRKIEMNNKS